MRATNSPRPVMAGLRKKAAAKEKEASAAPTSSASNYSEPVEPPPEAKTPQSQEDEPDGEDMDSKSFTTRGSKSKESTLEEDMHMSEQSDDDQSEQRSHAQVFFIRILSLYTHWCISSTLSQATDVDMSSPEPLQGREEATPDPEYQVQNQDETNAVMSALLSKRMSTAELNAIIAQLEKCKAVRLLPIFSAFNNGFLVLFPLFPFY